MYTACQGDYEKEPDEYRRDSDSVRLINYHFVFCPKRRKAVLTGEVARRLQDIIFEVCNENDWRLIALEIMPDHVHLFINAPPTDCPSVIVKRIKGRASHHLRREYSEVLKIPTLWTPSYFVATTGNACTETIKRYVENQKGK